MSRRRAASAEWSRTVEQAVGCAIFNIDQDGTIRTWNAGAERLFGWTAEEMTRSSADRLFPPQERDAGALDELVAAALDCETLADERWLVTKSGESVWCSSCVGAVRDDEGRIVALAVIVRDATRARLSHERLERAEALYRAFVEGVQDYAIMLMDHRGVITEWGGGAALMERWEAEEAVGQHLSFEYPPGGAEDGTAEDHLRIAAERGEYVGEGTRLRRGGEPFPARVTLTALYRDGQLIGYSKVARDLTEQRRYEANLRESEGLFRAAFDRAPSAMVLAGADGSVMRVNAAGCALVGYTEAELVGRDLLDLVDPDQRDATRRAPNPDPVDFTGVRLVRKDGSIVVVDAEATGVFDSEGALTSYVAQAWDVTELQRQEAQRRAIDERVRVAAQMEGLARLAGGLAHDINNQLSIVIGHADFVLSGRMDAEHTRHSAAVIRDAAARSAELTRRLLMFAGRDTSRFEWLDVDAALRDLQSEILRIVGPEVRVEVALDDDLGVARLTQVQLTHIVTALTWNAAEAMPDGGELRLGARRIDLTADATGAWAGLPAGRYVELTVTDTGRGMDAAVRKRAFEPFFSTKGDRRSAGLGLSVLWGIVHEAGGGARLDSEPGKGTSARVLVPAAAAPPHAPRPVRAQPAESAGQGERVLVVEDEAELRVLIVRMLRARGYVVEQAGDGVAALEHMTSAGPPDLLLTDIVMPRMSGRDLAHRVQASWPAVRVVFMSGHATDVVDPEDLRAGPVPFLAKPFRIDELLGLLRSVLGKAGPQASPG